MYELHEAREDTVLFPAFRKIVSKHEYDSLCEEFEKKENQIFHGDGFEKNVTYGANPKSPQYLRAPGRSRVLQNLIQMVPQVLEIVRHQECQWHIAIRRFPEMAAGLRIGVTHDVRQMPVVSCP